MLSILGIELVDYYYVVNLLALVGCACQLASIFHKLHI